MHNLRKLFLSLSVIVVFAAYSFQQRQENSKAVAGLAVPAPATSSNQINRVRGGENEDDEGVVIRPPATTVPAPATPGSYKDGTYTGKAADAYYGLIQVKVIISGGKLTDVQFLNHPNDNPTSQSINNQAMPMLKQEAITAQGGNVNGVSGATDTSIAFRESLQDALSQAR